jgi:hypothetical protein
MKKINTKLIAVLLTFVLTFSLMSIAAAAENDGDQNSQTNVATITYGGSIESNGQQVAIGSANDIEIFFVAVKQAQKVSCWTTVELSKDEQNAIADYVLSQPGVGNGQDKFDWEFHTFASALTTTNSLSFSVFPDGQNKYAGTATISISGNNIVFQMDASKWSHLYYGTYTPATTSSSPTPTESTTTSQSPAPTESATTSQSPEPTESATTSQSPAPTESATTSQSPAPTESATTSQSPAPTTAVPPTNPSAAPSTVPVIPGVIETPTTIVDETPPAAEPSIPAAETDPTTSAEVDIQEPEVPLADASQQVTGDSVIIWVILAVLSGTALVYTIVYDYKHSEKN